MLGLFAADILGPARFTLSAVAAAAMLAAAPPKMVRPGVLPPAEPRWPGGLDPRPFDFSDDYYRANGIDPAALSGRLIADGRAAALAAPPNPEHSGIRPLIVKAAYTQSGNICFFSTIAFIPNAAAFTPDAAGVAARGISETYCLYCFPRRTNPPSTLSPRRQEPIADMRNGYDTNNPLGIWKCNLVYYTDAAFNTPEGIAALDRLAERNGRDADGTPIIRRMGDLDGLLDGGLVWIEQLPEDGSKGPRWFICPVLQNPTGGAVASDARLDVTRLNNGSVLPASAAHAAAFRCLQITGLFCP